MNKFFLIVILSCLFSSCKDNAELSKNELNELKNNVINSGDDYSYSRLVLYYENKEDFYELLPYSLIMAEKYNKGNGYLMVYKDLIRLINKGKFDQTALKDINKDSRENILKYLERGSKLEKDGDCRFFLEKHYRFGVPPLARASCSCQ